MSRRGADLGIKRTLGDLNPNLPDENFSKILLLLKQKTGSLPYDEKNFLDLFRTRVNSRRELQVGALTNYQRQGKEKIVIEWMKRGGNISEPADVYMLLTNQDGLGRMDVDKKALVFLEWLRKPQNSCDKNFILTALSKILPGIKGPRKLAIVLEWLKKNTSDLTRADFYSGSDFTSNLNDSEVAQIHFEWLQKRSKSDLFRLVESPEFSYLSDLKRAEIFLEWLKISRNNFTKDELYQILQKNLPANLKSELLETWMEKGENNLTKEELFDLKNNFLKDVVKSQREKTYLFWLQRPGNNFSKDELFSFFVDGGDLAKSMTPERLAIFLKWLEKEENNLSYDELKNLFLSGPLSHFKDIAEDLKYENEESSDEEKIRLIFGFAMKCEDEMPRRELFALATQESQGFINSNNSDNVRARQIIVSDLMMNFENYSKTLNLLEEIILADFIHHENDGQLILSLVGELAEAHSEELHRSREAQQALYDFCDKIYAGYTLSQNKAVLRNFIERVIEPTRSVRASNFSRASASGRLGTPEDEREVDF